MRLARGLGVVAVLGLAGCVPGQPLAPGGSSACSNNPAALSETATFAFAGDVLLHAYIQAEAAARADGFAPAFAAIERYLAQADVTIVNLEGPAAEDVLPGGRAASTAAASRFDDRIYSGYPTFNYHPSIAPVLARAGVDVVQTANNHALDRGALGVDRTLDALQGAGLQTTGTVPQEARGPWHTVVEARIGGERTRVALLACADHVNGLPDPAGQTLRCYGASPHVPSLISNLLSSGTVEAVILLPHWGVEYSEDPSNRQRAFAQAVVDAGAVAIVGAHPHVLQPIETVVARDGREAPVAYSLGNFISTQWELSQRTGGVLYLDLGRDTQGRVVAAPPRLLPTRVVSFEGRGVMVMPASHVAGGAESVAHAANIIGADRIIEPSDVEGAGRAGGARCF